MVMGMREKLYELLRCNVCESQGCIICNFCDDEDACISYMEHRMADHLIANGVEIVKHGRWLQPKPGECFCSECKTNGSPQWKRCPICEAKMNGGDAG